jgi:hypothetical protein
LTSVFQLIISLNFVLFSKIIYDWRTIADFICITIFNFLFVLIYRQHWIWPNSIILLIMNLVLRVFGRPTKGIYLGIVYLSWTKYFIFCFFLSIMQILIRQIIIDFFSIENNRILLWKRPKVLMLKIPLLRFIIQPSNLLIFEVFLGMIFIWVNIHIF